jgi:PAS domain S-box-containing protein
MGIMSARLGWFKSHITYPLAELRAERDRSQRYLDTAAVFLLALDERGRITLANRCACSVLGWTADELKGRSWIETCVPPRMWVDVKQQFDNLIAGDLTIVENPVLTRAGEERLIEWRNTVLHDEAGRITGTFSSGTDITERSQAAAAVRIAEERTRFALESARVGIWDMDFATGVLEWSDILQAQYGLRPGSFAGTFDAFIAAVHPDDRNSLHEAVATAIASGTDFVVSHRALWPDGTVRWLSGAGRVLLGPEGQPVRGVGISLDVTDLHTTQLRVLRMTMRTVQDIVSNALMSLQGFREEAAPFVSPEALGLFDHLVADTARRLQAIGNLEKVAEKPMVIGMGIDYASPPPAANGT